MRWLDNIRIGREETVFEPLGGVGVGNEEIARKVRDVLGLIPADVQVGDRLWVYVNREGREASEMYSKNGED